MGHLYWNICCLGGALITLNAAMLNINNQLAVINNPANNVSPQEELVALQTARKTLNRIMQDQCADANAKIAHVNVTAFRREGEYHA